MMVNIWELIGGKINKVTFFSSSIFYKINGRIHEV